ncbi:class II aldolase/adducin N-terminal [Plectosphaerella cucumerina]|uniref:Class II aldolase/adducin N-terminal n=1 Tax=Plectosphaerella cucumerina TaxID=40658 RepID=A0A8K0X6Q1_9PEZI|nr:class II aldolase/adducin N-terminal [Plectosphaerella cucumerina]
MSTTTQTEKPSPQVPAPASAPQAPKKEYFQELVRGDRAGKLKLRGIPQFPSRPLRQRQWAKEHMAAAFRFFAKHGYAEGIAGHISMRDPILHDHLWFNPYAKHFASMRASDLVLVDAEGYVVEGGNQAVVNTAGFMIHSEVHKARPDVWAAAHAHSIHGKTWSAFGRPVEMLTQDACNLYGIQSVYDDHGGQAIAQEEGRAIAAALGPKSLVCILKNHGLLTVGRTVDEAAFLFYSLDQACHSQLLAEAAAANGIPKSIIADHVAQFNADVIQSADNFYIEFQPEFDLIVEESGGEVLK